MFCHNNKDCFFLCLNKLAKIVASLQYQFPNTGRAHGDRKELVTFFVIEWLGLVVKVFDDSSNCG